MHDKRRRSRPLSRASGCLRTGVARHPRSQLSAVMVGAGRLDLACLPMHENSAASIRQALSWTMRTPSTLTSTQYSKTSSGRPRRRTRRTWCSSVPLGTGWNVVLCSVIQRRACMASRRSRRAWMRSAYGLSGASAGPAAAISVTNTSSRASSSASPGRSAAASRRSVLARVRRSPRSIRRRPRALSPAARATAIWLSPPV